MSSYISDQEFKGVLFQKEGLSAKEYDYCRFINCDLSEVDYRGVSFSECVFEGCNLSLGKFNETGLKDVQFKDCKLLGLSFDSCNDFGFEVGFEDCALDNSVFYNVNLSKSHFKSCRLHGVDFVEANCEEAVFLNCDFKEAMFDQTNLKKADLRSSFNFILNPSTNRVKEARFSKSSLEGLLASFDIKIDKNS